MGFLTESSLLPKPARKIAGVNSSSLFSLKTLVTDAQRDLKQGTYARKRGRADPLEGQNYGVRERSKKDKRDMKRGGKGGSGGGLAEAERTHTVKSDFVRRHTLWRSTSVRPQFSSGLQLQ